MINNTRYYRDATVPAGMYRGTDREIKTFILHLVIYEKNK